MRLAAFTAQLIVFRFLGVDDGTDNDVHASEILRRVQDVIETGSNDPYNLSLGPDLPVDADEVQAWTSILDALSAGGEKLILAAAGNNGDLPERRHTQARGKRSERKTRHQFSN
jgi:hypothetical protein